MYVLAIAIGFMTVYLFMLWAKTEAVIKSWFRYTNDDSYAKRTALSKGYIAAFKFTSGIFFVVFAITFILVVFKLLFAPKYGI